MSEIPPDSDPAPNDSKAGFSSESESQERWRAVFEQSAAGLRAFLRGRLSQESDVDDCLQVVYLKMLTSGTNVAPAARRAWLFRVAANESARFWRSKASTDKMLKSHGAEEASKVEPIEKLIQSETSETLRQAINQLPETWQQVVRLRINESLTFEQTAQRLGIPLGTALTQMRRALQRLRDELRSNDL